MLPVLPGGYLLQTEVSVVLLILYIQAMELPAALRYRTLHGIIVAIRLLLRNCNNIVAYCGTDWMHKCICCKCMREDDIRCAGGAADSVQIGYSCWWERNRPHANKFALGKCIAITAFITRTTKFGTGRSIYQDKKTTKLLEAFSYWLYAL